MVTNPQAITFPVSYTNNPIVLITSYGTTGNIWVSTTASTTGFSVQANATTSFQWMSIGI
jgi:hypothetical protein